MGFKAEVYSYCQSFIAERISKIYHQITNVSEALTSESKSSAGDKHETGRAMLQLEREKLGQQLKEAEKTKEVLDRVNIGLATKKIGLGSLVITDATCYFIAISAGLCQLENKDVYCISSATPIGQLLMGKTAGEAIVFNYKTIPIVQVQ